MIPTFDQFKAKFSPPNEFKFSNMEKLYMWDTSRPKHLEKLMNVNRQGILKLVKGALETSSFHVCTCIIERKWVLKDGKALIEEQKQYEHHSVTGERKLNAPIANELIKTEAINELIFTVWRAASGRDLIITTTLPYVEHPAFRSSTLMQTFKDVVLNQAYRFASIEAIDFRVDLVEYREDEINEFIRNLTELGYNVLILPMYIDKPMEAWSNGPQTRQELSIRLPTKIVTSKPKGKEYSADNVNYMWQQMNKFPLEPRKTGSSRDVTPLREELQAKINLCAKSCSYVLRYGHSVTKCTQAECDELVSLAQAAGYQVFLDRPYISFEWEFCMKRTLFIELGDSKI